MSDIFCMTFKTIIPKLLGQTFEQKITIVKATNYKSMNNKYYSFTHEMVFDITDLSKPATRNPLGHGAQWYNICLPPLR